MTERRECEIRLPLSLDVLEGEYAVAKAVLIAFNGRCGLARLDDFTEIANEPDWTESCGEIYFDALDHGQTFRALRIPTEGDYQRLRVPRWIQDDETPTCCGEDMFFVGHLDDDQLWKEHPSDARLWWHDPARFYVFTCHICLSVKAVGQQS